MKRLLIWMAVLALILPCISAAGEQSGIHYGTLLADLVYAYENPGRERLERIDADTEAIGTDLARIIAEHWKKVYLDPDYRLYIAGKDNASDLPVERSHAIVVLGYELKDGEMTEELKGRCNAAAEVAKAFPASIIVCSGGATGTNNPENHTEAGMMKAYLSEQCHIDGRRVFTDEQAMTTAENAVNTLAILREQEIETMTIVTSTYHQKWGQVLYNAVAGITAREFGYFPEIIGNFCFETEPESRAYLQDDRIAASQLAGILGLSREERAVIPKVTRQ